MHVFHGFTSSFYTLFIILTGITKVAAGAPSKLAREVARGKIPTLTYNGDPCWNNILCISEGGEVAGATKDAHERAKRSSKKLKKSERFTSSNVTSKEVSGWPSLQDIIDQVHKNLTRWRKEEMIDYSWPYFYNFPTFETDVPPTEKPSVRKLWSPSLQNEDFMSKFVFRKIDTSSFKQSILAISIRKPAATSKKKEDIKNKENFQTATETLPLNNHTRHIKKLHEHLKAISATKARLHHRWLQKEKIQSKLLI